MKINKLDYKRASWLAYFMAIVLSGCTGSNAYPDPEIRIENLKSTVKHLTEIKPARSREHPGSLKKAADFIFKRFQEYELKPERQEYAISGTKYENIIASVGPINGERLIIGAHYDVCGDQPGADDNASAVAGLLEIARFAKKHEKELRYRIDFVAFTLEEPPNFETETMGSYIHAKSLHDKKVKVKGMICLEMIGFFSDKKDSQSYPLSIMKVFYPTVGNYIAVISNFKISSFSRQIAKHMRAASIEVRKLSAPSFIEGIDFSDHRNYWNFGYDAVMITDTSFYRNPNYHKTTDTIDTLNFAKMREVTKGVCWSILNMK